MNSLGRPSRGAVSRVCGPRPHPPAHLSASAAAPATQLPNLLGSQRAARPRPGPYPCPRLSARARRPGTRWRSCARWAAPRLALQSPPGWPDEEPGGPPAPRPRRRRSSSASGSGGQGRATWGWRGSQRQDRAQERGAAPTARPGSAQPGWGRARAGQVALPGQRGFPRAREASQEVEVFPKAVAARGCPTRGRRGWRPCLRLLEAQPPKGFEKTLLHGAGAAARTPGSLS